MNSISARSLSRFRLCRKIADDVDPKSVLCVFFKQGLCTKGKKCKFSHDLAMQQKTAKRNLYVDSRDLKSDDPKATETNENWDETQLNEVAEKKHGEKDRKRPNQTDIVCKYFIDAIEKSLYGWFWECPNGEKCIYKHALPPGYVLSKDKKKMDEQKRLDHISLDELIEKERANLSSKNQTKVTLETFIAWKKKKMREKRQKETQDEIKKRTNVKSGKQTGLTGRELFTYDENLANDNDDEEGGEAFVRQKEEADPDEIKAFEINDKTFMDYGDIDDIDDQENQANEPGTSKPLVFDENLFGGEGLEDLSDSSDDSEEEDGEDQSQSSVEDEIKTKLKI